ncbi:MAG: cytochrome b, partial [Rickettsiales bacterium]
MSEQETASNRYHPAQRVMHWLMAVLILGMIAIGWYMHGLERESELRPILYGLHKSTGVLVLMLFSIRVILRVKKGAPALPAAIKAWEA